MWPAPHQRGVTCYMIKISDSECMQALSDFADALATDVAYESLYKHGDSCTCATCNFNSLAAALETQGVLRLLDLLCNGFSLRNKTTFPIIKPRN